MNYNVIKDKLEGGGFKIYASLFDEDGISIDFKKGELEIGMLFDKSHELFDVKCYNKMLTYDYNLNLCKSNITEEKVNNLLDYLINPLKYFSELLVIYSKFISEFTPIFETEISKMDFKLHHDNNVDRATLSFEIIHDNTFTSSRIYIELNTLTKKVMWLNDVEWNAETWYEDLINYLKNSRAPLACQYLWDSRYSKNAASSVYGLKEFLRNYKLGRKLNNYSGYYPSGLAHNPFKLSDIPEEFQNLIDEYNQNTYTIEDFINYGQFQTDEHGSMIKPTLDESN